MARACGIRVGPRRFELFVLDGSPKKPKVVASTSGVFPTGEDAHAAAVQALKEAVREHGVPRDNVGAAIDGRCAAFRKLQLPFSDPGKIESVLKFEVEGQLPQFNIDDVVVDFHVLEGTPTQSSLLVTAVPKEELRKSIALLTSAGVEPLEVELDSTAMVNAAVTLGVCTVENAQIVVHVGEESTAVAVVDGTQVREMRVIQVGALSGRPDPRRAAAPAEDPLAEAGEASAPAREFTAEDEAHRLREVVGRIRRELARTVSGARTAHELSGVVVGGFRLPELEAGEVLGLPVSSMDEPRADSPAETDATADEEAPGAPRGPEYGAAIVAYGAALRQMGGGPLRPRLRREELRYSGAMERLELPLAVAFLLLVTLLGVFNIFVQKDREFVDAALASWRDSSNNYMYPDPKEGKPAKLRYPSDKLKSYVELLRRDTDDPERNRLEQLMWIRQMLRNDVAGLEKELGRDGEVQQPQSALRAMELVLDVVERNKDVIRRPSIRSIRGTYQPGRGGKPERVRVQMDITFFGDSTLAATQDFERFKDLLTGKPWYVDFEDKRSEPLDDQRGIYKSGIVIEVDVSKAGPVEATS